MMWTKKPKLQTNWTTQEPASSWSGSEPYNEIFFPNNTNIILMVNITKNTKLIPKNLKINK